MAEAHVHARLRREKRSLGGVRARRGRHLGEDVAQDCAYSIGRQHGVRRGHLRRRARRR